jgi:hypothetical protein
MKTDFAPLEAFFKSTLPALLKRKPSIGTQLKGPLQFEVSGERVARWYVEGGPRGRVVAGSCLNARCTVVCRDVDFAAMLARRLSPKVAFNCGRLRVKGDLGMAMKLGMLF